MARDLLGDLYLKAVSRASDLGFDSIALPALGAGINNFPQQEVASLALEGIQNAMPQMFGRHGLSHVEVVLAEDEDVAVWGDIAAKVHGWEKIDTPELCQQKPDGVFGQGAAGTAFSKPESTASDYGSID